MLSSDLKPLSRDSARESAAGIPAWITDDLIRLTLKVWGPRYRGNLTRQDAVSIIMNVGHLFGALAES